MMFSLIGNGFCCGTVLGSLVLLLGCTAVAAATPEELLQQLNDYE